MAPSLLEASPPTHFPLSAQIPHAQVQLSAGLGALGFPLWGTSILNCPTSWSSTGPAASSFEMSLEHTDPCQLPLPQRRASPPMPGTWETDQRSSGSHVLFQFLPGTEAGMFFPKATWYIAHPCSKGSDYCLMDTVYALWSGAPSLPQLANLPF